MDKIEIMGKMNIGFSLDGRKFKPMAYILMVDEADFGCEGRPENESVYVELYGYDASGSKTWHILEQHLDYCGYDDKMWLGSLEGVNGTVATAEGSGKWHVVPDGPWLDVFKG